MYDLSELTDLIHGCPGAEDEDLRPHDPNDPDDVAIIADIVFAMAHDDSPIGRLLASASGDAGLLTDLVVALAELGVTLRDAGHDEVVDAATLVAYGMRLPAPIGPRLIEWVSRRYSATNLHT